MSPTTIILWVHPRSTSTMFECACLQKQDTLRVLHEPLGDAFYFGPEKISNRYSQKQCQEEFGQYEGSTYEKVWSDIINPPSTGPQRTFSKDMASYIFPLKNSTSAPFPQSFTSSTTSTSSSTKPPSSSDTQYPTPPSSIHTPQEDGNPTLIPTSLLLDPSIIHTFLIRTPEKAIPSYERLCYPGSITGFNYFDSEEAGYRELRLLFDFIRTEGGGGKTPLLIESEDLLKDPVGVMKEWCENVEIEFDESMLEWNEGTREHFAKWPGFHTSAENSAGIGKGLKSEHCTNHTKPVEEGGKKVEQSKIVRDCIEENMEHYEYLKSFVKVRD